MSRGLGAIQREVLDVILAFSRSEELFYHGGQMFDGTQWVHDCGKSYKLRDDFIDLRAINKIMLMRRDLRFSYGSFQAAFSRAVNGLIRRGYLIDTNPFRKRRRFVQVAKRYEKKDNAYSQTGINSMGPTA